MIDKELKTYAPTRHPDLFEMTATRLSWKQEDTDKFNAVYTYCLDQENKGIFNRLTFTPCGGISISGNNLRGPMYALRGTKNMQELIVRDVDGWWTRLVLGIDKTKVSGTSAYRKLTKELKSDGIDIMDYMVTPEEGRIIKETIQSPLICWYEKSFKNVEFRDAHHIDINSSYWAGIIDNYPEFRPTIERIYSKRKKNDGYKAILTHSQGYFQGKPLNYRLAHLARAGIEWNNNTIVSLAWAVTMNGGTVIAYNTDGFWYTGPLYHDDREGPSIGQWKHDHLHCRLRFKSPGAYEYVENGIYHPVLRGRTNMDDIKPRSEWKWGDIYAAGLKVCFFEENVGVVWLDENNI